MFALFVQIPGDADSRSVSSPEEELTRRFKDVMRRIFWDRFTQSLLPPPSPVPNSGSIGGGGSNSKSGSSSNNNDSNNSGGSNGDNNNNNNNNNSSIGGGSAAGVTEEGFVMHGGVPLKVGTKVHARYASERGSYYAATVLAVITGQQAGVGVGAGGGKGGGTEGVVGGGQGGVFVDVRYDEDGIVERGIPVSRLRKGGDPPDFGPLLSLLGEVRGRKCDGWPARGVDGGREEIGRLCTFPPYVLFMQCCIGFGCHTLSLCALVGGCWCVW